MEQAKAPIENISDSIGTQLVKLPSRGKLYPVEHPLNGKEDVEIKYMTAAEEDILTSPALIKRGLVFSTLLKSCMVDKTINPDELLISDRNAILIALRCTGYGELYNVSIMCSENDCMKQFEHEFDMNKLNIKFVLDEHVEKEFENLFTFVLPFSKKTVKFKLMNALDDREIDETEDNLKKAQPGILVEKRITSRLIKQIISIDGNENKHDTSKLVLKLRAGDSRALRKRIEEVNPGVVMEQEASCPHCGTKNVFDVPMTPAFFWPDI